LFNVGQFLLVVELKGATLVKDIFFLRALSRDESAVTALEYGIIASILGLVLVGIFTSFGGTLTTLFSSVSTSI
jgi:pilus assembly protein Flp/PilA